MDEYSKYIKDTIYELVDKFGLTKEFENKKARMGNDFLRLSSAMSEFLLKLVSGTEVKYKNASGDVLTTTPYNDALPLYVLAEKAKNPSKEIKDVLLDSDFFITTIEGQAFYNMDRLTGKYLEKYCPMYKIASDISFGKIENVLGGTVKVYKKYLSSAYRISNSKDMLAVDGKIDDISILKSDFELRYVQKQICGGNENELFNTYISNFDMEKYDELNKMCQSKDISSRDLMYRIYKGMKVPEAVKIGLQEKERYNLTYAVLGIKNTNAIRLFYNTLIKELWQEKEKEEQTNK